MNDSDSPVVGAESLESRIASDQRRRAFRKTAGALGLYALIGTSTLIGELMAGSVQVPTILVFASGILMVIAVAIFWRDELRPRVPNEELKPPASPSSLVE